MKLQELFLLTESEIHLLESDAVFKEIQNIVKSGIKAGVEKISRSLHDYATGCLHKFDKESKAFKMLSKIIANPTAAANQLMASTIKDDALPKVIRHDRATS